ncbi:formiminoglutamase [Catalinimonas alkaloidigena]|uniref:formimidoylglutamase n=1 Tax=Catalinimonas alkaloidigena TaxID=1075417 RepID=UPI0024051799|nr:formimidoylglutamase [Catalinimonas alkaloidigena]MDF9794870.1 formiminoglutamase [Catalinimonas alkaloidigena]
MNLSIFFQPVEADVYREVSAANSFFRAIQVYTDTFPNYEEADIAIVGLSENRGNHENGGAERAANSVRQVLYHLKKGSGAYKVVDLGNLNSGHSLEETYLRIKEVCETLINHNTFPILIGGTHDLDYGQYQAYESMEKLINVLSVDAFIDIDPNNTEGVEGNEHRNHLHKTLVHDPNYLLNYSHIAYQSYLVDNSVPILLDKFYFDTYRLGLVNQNLNAMEPVIRAADMLSFDITAIRMDDAPGNRHAQAFGLSGQEACQLCWYAGHSEKLTSAGFYEYNPDWDNERKKTASVIATMVWYIIEGYYHRTYESNFESNDFIKYIVPMPSKPSVLTFYKAKKSEKWWMEVPNPQVEAVKERQSIVPCDPSDYEMATKGELPDRWIQNHAKYL